MDPFGWIICFAILFGLFHGGFFAMKDASGWSPWWLANQTPHGLSSPRLAGFCMLAIGSALVLGLVVGA